MKTAWYRIFRENGALWVNGVKIRNFLYADGLPKNDNLNGFLRVANDGEMRYVPLEDMNKLQDE